MLAASAAFFGCKKDDNSSPVTTVEDIDVTPRVKAFVERAQLMDQRDNVPITVDSAEWYIEAALNLTVAQTWLECTNYQTDSLEYSISSDGGMIASDDAAAAFLSLQAQATEMITPDENHLVVADVMFLPSDDGAYTIKVLLQFGSGYEKTLNTSYGPNDYWYFGYDLANCGCGPNQNASGTCANKKIQSRVNSELGLIELPCYWINVETRGNHSSAQLFFSPTSYPTGIPATPYPVYWCVQQQSCADCFSPSMMSFYTQGAWNFMQAIKPAGKQPISLTMDYLYNLCGPGCDTKTHNALYYYGKKQCPR